MAKKIYTKEIVFKAALKIAKEVGLEKVGIRAIARELNTSVSPVYDAYESKDMLIEDIVITILDENAAHTSYFKRNEEVLLYGIKHPKLYRDMQKYTREKKLETTHYKDLMKLMRQEEKLRNLPDQYLQSLNFDILIYISGLVNLSMSNHLFGYEDSYYLDALTSVSELLIRGYRSALEEEQK
jgi:AcrR family transcriptional regulator